LGRAEEHLDTAREYFVATGNERIKPWIQLADAWLADCSGNPTKARRILVELRNDEADRNGLAFQAGVEDHLLLVNARLGEWEESAIAWQRGRQVRHASGLVPTAFERDLSRPAKTLLKERLGIDGIRDRLIGHPSEKLELVV
jgi:hypothetical protein